MSTNNTNNSTNNDDNGIFYTASAGPEPRTWKLNAGVKLVHAYASNASKVDITTFNMTGVLLTSDGVNYNCELHQAKNANQWIVSIQTNPSDPTSFKEFGIWDMPSSIQSIEIQGDETFGFKGFLWDSGYNKMEVKLSPIPTEKNSNLVVLKAAAGGKPNVWRIWDKVTSVSFAVDTTTTTNNNNNTEKVLSGTINTNDGETYICKASYWGSNLWDILINTPKSEWPIFRTVGAWTLPAAIDSITLSGSAVTGYTGTLTNGGSSVSISLSPMPESGIFLSPGIPVLNTGFGNIWSLNAQVQMQTIGNQNLINSALSTSNKTSNQCPPTGCPSGGVASDNVNGWIYCGLSGYIAKFDFAGNNMSFLNPVTVRDLAIDMVSGNLWVARYVTTSPTTANGTSATIPSQNIITDTYVYDVNGDLINTIHLSASAVAYDAASNLFWMGANVLYKLSPDGVLLNTIDLYTPDHSEVFIEKIVVDAIAERVWVAYDCISVDAPYHSCGVIAIFDLEGSLIHSFLPYLAPPIQQSFYPVSSLQAGVPAFVTSMAITTSNIQSMSLAPVNGHVFLVVGETNLSGISSFRIFFCDVHGQYGAPPVANLSAASTLDKEGNLWNCSFVSNPNGTSQMLVRKWDSTLKPAGQLMMSPINSSSLEYMNMSNITNSYCFIPFQLKPQPAIPRPYLTTSAKLIQNYSMVNGSLQETTTYRVEIKCKSGKGSFPTTISLLAQSNLSIIVKGVTYSLNNLNPLSFDLEFDESLVLDIPAVDIITPSIFVRASFMKVSGDYLVVNPAQQIHHELSEVTSGQLQDASGKKTALLPAADFTSEQADHVAKAIRNVMAVSGKSFEITDADASTLQSFVAGQPVPSIIPSLRYRQMEQAKLFLAPAKKYQHYSSVSDEIDISYLSNVTSLPSVTGYIVPELVDREDPHWSLSFAHRASASNGLTANVATVKFTPLSFAEASAKFDALQLTGLQHNISFGDFFKSVASGATKLSEVVVRTVNDTVDTIVDDIKETVHKIELAITDIAGKVANFVMRTISDAVEFMKGIFAQIGVAINKVIDFLKSIFDWEDIIHTQQVLKTKVNELQVSLKSYVKKAENWAIDGITGFKNQVTTSLSQMAKSYDSTKLEYAVDEGKSGNEYNDNMSASWLINTFKANNGSKLIKQTFTGEMKTSFMKIFDELKKIGEEDVNNGAFKTAKNKMDIMLKDPDSIPKLLLSTIINIIEGLIDLILSIAVKLVTILAEVLTSIIDSIFDLLNKEIYIPIITDIYQKFSSNGHGFSFIDLATFLVAAPTTVIYRLVYNSAPFANTSVSGSVAATGLQANDMQQENQPQPQVDHYLRAANIILLVSSSIGLITTSISSFMECRKPKDASSGATSGASTSSGSSSSGTSSSGTGSGTSTEVSIAYSFIEPTTLICDMISVAFSGSLIKRGVDDFNKSDSEPSQSERDWYEALNWYLWGASCATLIIDGAFLVFDGKLGKYSKQGSIATGTFGALNIAASGAIAHLESKNNVENWQLGLSAGVCDGVSAVCAIPLNISENRYVKYAAAVTESVTAAGSLAINATKVGKEWNP